ncbi:MAG TPA: hypothetical protein VLX92_15635 [Kofleriaceae bacterium]|nr:hypothetical protein [Kofleriaceae bacterium]
MRTITIISLSWMHIPLFVSQPVIGHIAAMIRAPFTRKCGQARQVAVSSRAKMPDRKTPKS